MAQDDCSMQMAFELMPLQRLGRNLLALGANCRADRRCGKCPESRSWQIGGQAVCRQLRGMSSQRTRSRQGSLQSNALLVPTKALHEQFGLGLGAHLLSGMLILTGAASRESPRRSCHLLRPAHQDPRYVRPCRCWGVRSRTGERIVAVSIETPNMQCALTTIRDDTQRKPISDCA